MQRAFSFPLECRFLNLTFGVAIECEDRAEDARVSRVLFAMTAINDSVIY